MRWLILLACVISLAGCAVPGRIEFKKSGDRWEAITIEIESENITPGEICKFESRLNGE
jgi:hypothetical protein